MKHYRNDRFIETNAHWIISVLGSLGIEQEELAQNLGLRYLAPEKSTLFIGPQDYYGVLEYCANRLQTSAIGIELAKTTNFLDFGLYGYLLENSPSVGSRIETAVKFVQLFGNGFELKFGSKGDIAYIDYQVSHPQRLGSVIEIEFTLAFASLQFKNLFGEHWLPDACKFSYAKPKDTSKYQEIFGDNLCFDSYTNQLTFPSNLLNFELETSDIALFHILETHASSMIKELDSTKNIEYKIEQCLIRNLGKRSLTKELVIELLNMSERSINRHLELTGTSFSNIRKRVLVNAAKRALIESNSSIAQIAFWLGYSESSSLSRHFKQVTGVSPREYRNR
jgi:AraC-like DNA-binding protein